MCVVSMITTDWNNRNLEKFPDYFQPNQIQPTNFQLQQQLTELKKEMEELKKLLLAAKEYDKNTGQPDCEMEEKVDLIKKIADLVGVDMKEVFQEYLDNYKRDY